MRIVAWNVAHQEAGRKKYEKVVSENGTFRRLIVSAERLVNALVDLKADVAFLSEYRRSREDQVDEDTRLALAGFNFTRTVVIPRTPADSRKRYNQTLVAARQPITVVKSAADNAPEYALDNFLHIVLSGFDIVGLRIPHIRARQAR